MKYNSYMQVFFNNPEIGYMMITQRGKVIETEHCFEEIWEGAYLDIATIKVGERPLISFNVRENKKIGKQPVYDLLQTEVEAFIKIKY